MFSFRFDDLPEGFGGGQSLVAPCTPRCAWQKGLVVAGTVDTIAVATAGEFLTPSALLIADTAAAGQKVVAVPTVSNYMEVGIWGTSATLSTKPIVEFWRTHGRPGSNRGGSVDVWSLLRNVNGDASVTFDGTIIDTTGTAGATQYTSEEGTYKRFIFDLRGARIVVVRLTTPGAGGNWSLWHRFF